METYDVLERLGFDLSAVPAGDAAARYRFCWAWVPELAEAVLNDLAAVTEQRGFVQETKLRLNPRGLFSTGGFFFELSFAPQEPFSVSVQCYFAAECSVQLRILNEAEGKSFRRAATLLSGPAYDNGWVELNTLKKR
ncbi:hypothetical protein GCM10027048_44750 [Hymenobacter coalescens]